VIVARRTEALRRKIVLALAALLALLVAWYGLSWLQTKSSHGDLDDANHHSAALHGQQAQYAPLVTAQNQSAAIAAQLSALMVGDLQWKQMLAALHAAAGTDVTVGSISGSITAGAAAVGSSATANSVNGAGIQVLNTSGRQAVGTIQITGGARDKDAVATYVDRLGSVKGIATPFVSSVSQDPSGHWVYTVQAVVTTDALGGRYAAPARGGK
jgi:Tfp pilus assembly protein PilN